MKASSSVAEIARVVGSGAVSARDVVVEALGRIEAHNQRLGAFTDVLRDRALEKAAAVDEAVKNGKTLPLAGVPFGAKNLFDLTGLATRAGSKINRDLPPATADAALVRKLEAAGAICVGALNMGEYAYDFTGENVTDGPSRNPHDLNHMTGGSSGGSGSAVAAGLVPLSLGSDTNGSIRVPASLCGLFGLKPTYGRLSRHGTFPFVPSFDHLGPLARSVEDLAMSYDAMQGFDDDDPHMVRRPLEPVAGRLERGSAGLRIAIADGYFAGDTEPREMMEFVAKKLDVTRRITIPDAQAARAAAFLITMVEGATLHLERLRERPLDFDPAVAERLLAGAMLPGAWVERAQRFRRQFHDKMMDLFKEVDVILAPATPMRAPMIGQKNAIFGGVEMPIRPHMGIFTQPISFIGLPVAAAPIWLEGHKLPLAVQAIAAPWREDFALRVARQLEKVGAASAPVARGFSDD
ncbi:MAG: AtzE family amidohydrolase [Hyphomicrobiales bacterium]|nr:MAG: AtzE family amidohydrolase [Hyphomicrobiales bacterium]